MPHLCQVWFARLLIKWCIVFGRMNFPGTRWYAVTVRDPQMVRDHKKFGNGYQPRWFGNVSRMPQGRLTRRVLLLPTRRRSRSQPRTRLYNYIYDLAWSHQATTPAIPPERKSGWENEWGKFFLWYFNPGADRLQCFVKTPFCTVRRTTAQPCAFPKKFFIVHSFLPKIYLEYSTAAYFQQIQHSKYVEEWTCLNSEIK